MATVTPHRPHQLHLQHHLLWHQMSKYHFILIFVEIAFCIAVALNGSL